MERDGLRALCDGDDETRQAPHSRLLLSSGSVLSFHIMRRQILSLISAASVGLALGHVLFDDSAKLGDLQRQLTALSTRGRIHDQGHPRSVPATSGSVNRSIATVQQPPLDLSPVETAQALDLNARKEAGEYVLASEHPFSRRASQQLIERAVSQARPAVLSEYQRAFSELGMDEKTGSHLALHAAKIQQASVEAEIAIAQLQQARGTYEQRLNSVLSEDDMKRYRKYEDSKPSVREFEALQKYVASQKLDPLEPSWQDPLTTLIQGSQAYSIRSWDGPLDGLPQPTFGEKMVTSQIEDDLRRIADAKVDIIRKAASSGVPEQYRKLLDDYYSHVENRKRQEIATIRSRLATTAHPKPKN
jgi:hypothetical protein